MEFPERPFKWSFIFLNSYAEVNSSKTKLKKSVLFEKRLTLHFYSDSKDFSKFFNVHNEYLGTFIAKTLD